MDVRLSPRWEAMIRAKIDNGTVRDASDVVGEALRLMEERDRLDRFRAAIAVGDAQAARGEVVDWTPDLIERLTHEAAEEERLGVPIHDDVAS